MTSHSRLREIANNTAFDHQFVDVRKDELIALLTEIERLRAWQDNAVAACAKRSCSTMQRDRDDAERDLASTRQLLAASEAECQRLSKDRDGWSDRALTTLECRSRERDVHADQLAAMTAARDEACEIAERVDPGHGGIGSYGRRMERIASLRKVGEK